jgi:hypothetical protein
MDLVFQIISIDRKAKRSSPAIIKKKKEKQLFMLLFGKRGGLFDFSRQSGIGGKNNSKNSYLNYGREALTKSYWRYFHKASPRSGAELP